MKCWDCCALKLDGFYHCLLAYPEEPDHMKDLHKDFGTCHILEKYMQDVEHSGGKYKDLP